MNTTVTTSPTKVPRAPWYHCILPKAKAWEKRQSWKGKQAVLVVDSLPWQFARILFLKASLYAQGTPATPSPAHCSSCSTAKTGNGALREFAWDKEKYSGVPNLLPRCTWDGSTWAMPRHLQSLHFLCPYHPSSHAGADLLPGIWHMVSLGPARAIMAAPNTVPPKPGERKTDLCKGQLMRKLFASRSAGSAGEEQGSSQVARLSDDNKLAQPEHATSSNARLFPLFWENKRGTRLFLARSCPA